MAIKSKNEMSKEITIDLTGPDEAHAIKMHKQLIK